MCTGFHSRGGGVLEGTKSREDANLGDERDWIGRQNHPTCIARRASKPSYLLGMRRLVADIQEE